MTVLSNKTESQHYYERDGEPAYGASMKEVRQRGLIPSMTTILGIASNWTLNQWQQRQVGISAWNNPRHEADREMDAWIDARMVEAKEIVKDAADFGTRFHDGAEAILNGDSWDESDQWLIKFKDWADANVINVFWTEANLVHPTMIAAGRADAYIDHKDHGRILLDYKTRKLRPLKKGGFSASGCRYDKDIRQLAAYSDCMDEKPRVMNLYVHRDEAAAPVGHLWSEDDQANGLNAFMALAEFWCLDKKYDPRTWVPAEEATK